MWEEEMWEYQSHLSQAENVAQVGGLKSEESHLYGEALANLRYLRCAIRH